MKTPDNLKFETAFYEELIQKDPDFIDALIPLAENYTRAGNYEKGLKIDQRLSKLLPHDPIIQYNLACSYSILGKLNEAFKCMEQAIAFGYSDFSHMDADPDLENLRKSQLYQDLKSRISSP